MSWLNHKMRRISFLLPVLLLLMFFSLKTYKDFGGKPSMVLRQSIANKNDLITIKHASHMFDATFFEQAYEKGKDYKKEINGRVVGGIIPHHLLASPLIAGFFEGVSKQKVDTVILIGPNHYNVGTFNIATSKAIWNTIYGDIQPDTEKINKLQENKVAFVSEDLFENEHSVYGITTFIKKTFPNSHIVPIVLKSMTTRIECDNLIEVLSKIDDTNALVIASVDFSHYLTSDEADIYDKQSLEAIESFSLERIFSLSPTKNFDSPPSIYTLAKLMQEKSVDTPVLIKNTNSAKLVKQRDLESTTSYVTMYFTDQNLLSLDSIFKYTNPEQAVKSKSYEYSIVATGDVIPARSVNAKMVSLNNFTFPFEKTASLLKNADAVFINLESPLIPNCKPTFEGMIFCGDQRGVEGLVYAGVKVTSIANNHAGNYGIEGINSTVNLLKHNDIQVTGNSKSAILFIKDKKFGFLGYNDIGGKESGIVWASKDQIKEDIQKLKNQADFVIVTFHWGTEYTANPNERQKDLAHSAIDAGADLIIGNHPHWVQGIEQYKGKFVTYAHGNYVFDQMWSQETREGVIGEYVFNKVGLANVKFFPVIIDNYSTPRFANKAEANKILERMKQSSLAISQHFWTISSMDSN